MKRAAWLDQSGETPVKKERRHIVAREVVSPHHLNDTADRSEEDSEKETGAGKGRTATSESKPEGDQAETGSGKASGPAVARG